MTNVKRVIKRERGKRERIGEKISKLNLSAKQKEVAKMMRMGWELGSGSYVDPSFKRTWLQEGDLGRPGNTEQDVPHPTFNSLKKKGLIKRAEPNTQRAIPRYVLTQEGEQVADYLIEKRTNLLAKKLFGDETND